jgi:hypothetical protein
MYNICGICACVCIVVCIYSVVCIVVCIYSVYLVVCTRVFMYLYIHVYVCGGTYNICDMCACVCIVVCI